MAPFKMSTLFGFLLAVLFATSASEAGQPHPYQFNVYTLGDIGTSNKPYGSDFQGPAAMGGNGYFGGFSGNDLGPAYSYSMYSKGSFNLYSGAINNGGIEAGGNVFLNSASVNGNVHGGGNLQGGYGTINGNVSIQGTNTSNMTIYGTVSTQQPFNSSLNYSSVSHYFKNASQFWGNLAPTATFTNVFGQLQLSNLVSGRNIVDLSFADLSSAYGIKLTGPADAFVIFNIDDATLTNQLLKDVTFSLNGGMAANSVLYNLINVTQLTLSGGQYLNILATGASIQFPSGLVTGNLIADNLYGSGQVNQGYFSGFPIDEHHFVQVPEPSTYFIMGTFLALAAVGARKRKASKA